MASGGDVLKAARKVLAANTALTALLGSGNGMDTWILRVNAPDVKPPMWFEGSERAMVVLSTSGGWAGRNLHNTASFPALNVGVFIDPGRNSNLQREELYLRDRFLPIWTQLDVSLDITLGQEIMWDDMRIVSSRRLNEWSIYRVNDTDGAYTSSARYALQV